MYYVDSPMRRIDMFDYDPAVGEAFQRRVFADLSAFDGVPDGLTVDADGYVWVAIWGGGVLRRFAPDGSQDAVLPVPVSQPTSCAFGGPGMSDLYVTTARVGLTEAELKAAAPGRPPAPAQPRPGRPAKHDRLRRYPRLTRKRSPRPPSGRQVLVQARLLRRVTASLASAVTRTPGPASGMTATVGPSGRGAAQDPPSPVADGGVLDGEVPDA